MKTAVRKPKHERREEIAVALLRVIGEQGLASLTTATLAKEVGVTSGALFRHFPNLEEILREATRYAVQLIEGTFPDPALPPTQRIVALAKNRVLLLGKNKGLSWLLRSEQAYLTLPRDAVERLRKAVRQTKQFVLTAIRDGMKQGSIRTDLDAELLLVPVMGTIHALIGMPGVAKGRQLKTGKVMDTLLTLLAPTVEKEGNEN